MPEPPQRLPARREGSEGQNVPAPQGSAGVEAARRDGVRPDTFRPRSAEDRAEDFLVDWVRRFSRG